MTNRACYCVHVNLRYPEQRTTFVTLWQVPLTLRGIPDIVGHSRFVFAMTGCAGVLRRVI